MSCAVRNRAAPNTSGYAPMTRDTTDDLLFDLGDVVFDLDFIDERLPWAPVRRYSFSAKKRMSRGAKKPE